MSDPAWKYPAEPPKEKPLLPVSSNPAHTLFWQEFGNPEGESVMFLHGGPGGGTSPDYARVFDPERYRILLFDQRGCGKSEPNATTNPQDALKANTTDDLIADIEKIRAAAGIKGTMHVFGGSWGSTLALAYAIKHPAHVQSLILRGIFLCRKRDLDYFYQGNAANMSDQAPEGAYHAYPDAWKSYVAVIPEGQRHDMIKAYAAIFNTQDSVPLATENKRAAALAWSQWEFATSYLHPKEPEAPSPMGTRSKEINMARIENHYFMNGAFLGGSGEANRDNNYLLEHVEEVVRHNPAMPIRIVQGKHDEVCPPFQAQALFATLKDAGATDLQMVMTEAGHSMTEPETLAALTRMMDDLPAQEWQTRDTG